MSVKEVTKVIFELIEKGELEAEEITATGINQVYFQGDMRSYEDALEVFEEVQSEFIYY